MRAEFISRPIQEARQEARAFYDSSILPLNKEPQGAPPANNPVKAAKSSFFRRFFLQVDGEIGRTKTKNKDKNKGKNSQTYSGTDPCGRPACFVPAPTERRLKGLAPDDLLEQAVGLESESNNFTGDIQTGMRIRAEQILEIAIQTEVEAEEKWKRGEEVTFDLKTRP